MDINNGTVAKFVLYYMKGRFRSADDLEREERTAIFKCSI